MLSLNNKIKYKNSDIISIINFKNQNIEIKMLQNNIKFQKTDINLLIDTITFHQVQLNALNKNVTSLINKNEVLQLDNNYQTIEYNKLVYNINLFIYCFKILILILLYYHLNIYM